VVTENALYKSNECSDCPFRWCTFSLSPKMAFTVVFEENVVIEPSPDLRALCVESPPASPCRPAGRNSSGRAFAGSANHKQQLAHQAVVQASHGQDQQQPQGIDFALHNSSWHLANALTPDETLLFRAQSPDLSGKHARRCCRGYKLPGRAAEVC
jgi:hypothetical protein